MTGVQTCALPILPLVASSVGTDQLLGGSGSRPASVDPLAVRTLVKGEPLAAPAGRADDFAWPRREIGREQAKELAKGESKGESPAAATAPPEGTAPAAAAAAPPKPPAKKQFRPAQVERPATRDFFGFGTAPPPRQIAPPPPRPPGPVNPGILRPPGSIGRSAEVPAGPFTRW